MECLWNLFPDFFRLSYAHYNIQINTSSAFDLANSNGHTAIATTIQEHIQERNTYNKLKKALESFFDGTKLKPSDTTDTRSLYASHQIMFFLPKPIVDIITRYAKPTIELSKH